MEVKNKKQVLKLFSARVVIISEPNTRFNHIQAGVFWNHIGWYTYIHTPLCSPHCFSFICRPITTKLGIMVLWDKISQKP